MIFPETFSKDYNICCFKKMFKICKYQPIKGSNVNLDKDNVINRVQELSTFGSTNIQVSLE